MGQQRVRGDALRGVPVLVRPFREGDLERLVAMYDDISPEHWTMGLPPRSRGDIENWIETLTRDGWDLVAIDDDRVVGHVGVASAPASAPHFVVFVHQKYQSRGIGTELVKPLLAYADRDYEEIRLSVSTDNRWAIEVHENVDFEIEDVDLDQALKPAEVEMQFSFPHPTAEHVRLPPAER